MILLHLEHQACTDKKRKEKKTSFMRRMVCLCFLFQEMSLSNNAKSCKSEINILCYIVKNENQIYIGNNVIYGMNYLMFSHHYQIM